MAINLSNVNISLRQFQEISSGKFNAGEVKLTSETGIDKVNNHVTMKFLNTTDISHEEVLAIKNAFVKALRAGGVDGYELNRIREELGLSPMKPVDKTLHERSVKPLSRQQIREILDRNAAVINQHEGPGTIRTSQQIHAGVSEETLASRAADRDATNAGLDTRRDVVENQSISNLQAVLAGDVDFVPSKDRKELLATARQCLDAVLVGCKFNPRDNGRATIQCAAPGGKNVVLSTGLSQKALVRKLEDIIVRLASDQMPSNEQLAFRDEFKALATPEARAAWAANLVNVPDGAYKARVVAVMILHDRGIDDAETLSVVNRLKNVNAITFVSNLVAEGMNLEGDALRAGAAVETALACADPDADISVFECAYIPALTDKEFNAEICMNMGSENGVAKLPATFRKLVIDAASEVRGRYGDVGYPDGANPSYLKYKDELSYMIGTTNPNAPRITTEALRENYIRSALMAGAVRVFNKGVEARLKTAGITVKNPLIAANGVRGREDAVMQRILAAGSLKAADAVLDDYIDLIVACGKRAAACERCLKSIGDRARAALAEKLGVPVASLSGKALCIDGLNTKANALRNSISDGSNKADSEDEVEAEFKKLIDKFVDERAQAVGKIDKSDLPAEAKAAFKSSVLSMDKVHYLDIDAMVAAAKAISADKLAELLAAYAPKAQIFAAMRDITADVTAAMNKMFEAARKAGKEIGSDEKGNFVEPLIAMIVLSKPELAGNLVRFLDSNAMVGEKVYSLDGDGNHPAANFLAFKLKYGANVEQDFAGYGKLAGAHAGGSFTSSTVAPGNGPVATAFRNIIDTRSGAPDDALPAEKAKAFAAKVNVRGDRNMAGTLATVASKNLVVTNGGQKQLDFDSVNYQFNRDLQGEYKFYFPGEDGPSSDYNTNRDRLVRFVTGDSNASFANASEATKRKVGILMAMLTQYTSTMATDTVSSAISLPGSGTGFTTYGAFGEDPPKPEFRLSKDAAGNIKIHAKGGQSVKMLVIIGENNQPLSMNQVKGGSRSEYEMEITLPKDNLETLANADWTKYDREAVNSYTGDEDGRVELIPPEFRFTGTVNIAYHLHLNEV